MLYALPDHQVMQTLLPGIENSRVSTDEAVARLRDCPGLVPVAIDPSGAGSVYFADIGTAPYLEWKHIYTVERLARDGVIRSRFVTDAAVLERELPIGDHLDPDGFIFHVSRCGSTLLSKVLAQLPENLIINQGGPLQEGFWAAATDHWQRPLSHDERTLQMFRNLLRLLARRRRSEYRRCFVKFISWNVVYADFVKAAFPGTATIYLYRDPVEVIATVLQETTAVLRTKGTPQAQVITGLTPADSAAMDDIGFLAHCYAHYFRLIHAWAQPLGLSLVNYRATARPECLADILARGFGWRPEASALEQMQMQFRYNSKDDSGKSVYQGEPEQLTERLSSTDRSSIVAITRAPLAALDTSPQNLFPETADPGIIA